jgi:hypothetical protein
VTIKNIYISFLHILLQLNFFHVSYPFKLSLNTACNSISVCALECLMLDSSESQWDMRVVSLETIRRWAGRGGRAAERPSSPTLVPKTPGINYF